MAEFAKANLRRVAGGASSRGALATKQSIVATKKKAGLLRRKGSSQRRRPIADTHQRPAARHARDFARNVPPLKQRAWGMPGARCTRSPLCNVESTGVEATGPPESPGIPARNGFNSLCRALPGDRALLPPSSRGYLARPRPVGPTCLPQNLTPASGRQDHTILPSAATSLVSGLFDRSQAFRLALRSHRAQNAAASTASHPAFVTIMIRPSVWDGMAKVLEVIWGV